MLGFVGAACASDDGWETAAADEVWLAPDGMTLTIGTHCHDSSRVAVDQEDDGVFVHWELLGEPRGDCLDLEQIVLDEPIGQRDVRYWYGRFLAADVIEYDPDVAEPGCRPAARFDIGSPTDSQGPTINVACWWRGDWHAIEADGARLDPDGDFFELGTHCHRAARFRFLQSRADALVVALEVLGSFRGDCASVVSDHWVEGLGDRALIDAVSGAEIPVETLGVELD